MLRDKDNKMKSSIGNIFKKWEFTIFVILIAVFAFNLILSPELFRIENFFDATLTFMEKSIMALPMTLLIISGVIDISIASVAAMSGVILGICFKAGINIWLSVVIGLMAGSIAGLINGLIITKLKMPSIVVTLATMLLYRGIGYILLGDTAVRNLPEKFGILGGAYSITFIPIQFIIFIILAIIFGLILHSTTLGRQIYAIGSNESTARYSGIPVDRIRIILCAIMGLISGLTGVLLTSRITSARPDMAYGNEFLVITIVLLGGVYIFGGRGSIIGVIISAFIIGYVYYGLSLLNIQAQVIRIVNGVLLIIALLIPTIAAKINIRERRRLKEVNK